MEFRARMVRIYEHRGVLWTLVKRDLRIRYARSALGYLWTLIDPLAMALVYSFVFGVIYNSREVMAMPITVYIISGLLAWNWFSVCINETSRSLYAERLLVRSTNLPRELWVIRVVLSKGIEHLLSLPILGLFVAFYAIPAFHHDKMSVNWHLIFIIPALLIQLVLCVGMGLVMAPVTALVDDFIRIVRIILRVLFYFSPIVYELATVDKRMPFMAHLLQFNPLTGIMNMYRIGLVRSTPDWNGIILSVLISAAWLVFGMWVFSKLERRVLKEI